MGIPTGDPLTDAANWQGPYRVFGGNDPAWTPNATDDGMGRPMQSSSTLAQPYETPDISGYDALKAYENAGDMVIVAEQKPDGAFKYKQNVEIAVRLIPTIDKSSFQSLRINVYGTELSTSDLSTTAPEWAAA